MWNELVETDRREGRARSAALAASCAAVAILVFACSDETAPAAGARAALPGAPSTPATPADFVGSARCASCHVAELRAWLESDHAHAMQPASAAHVRGDFEASRALLAGVSSTFERRDGKYFVRTEDEKGESREFEASYVFGRDPLQQLLISFPRGVMQALGVAWDTRPKEAGGQRWFHLYPQDPPQPGDPLHWTGREQRWNHQCAECHSTNVEKRYDRERDTYDTRYAEISVGCEACHGAGSRHVAWAETGGAQRDADERKGFERRLARARGAWAVRDMQRGIAEWQGEPRGDAELDNCARCHARRGPLVEHSLPEARFLDAYRPALLEEGLYHADGQILDEVFEWGSFVQSKMHKMSVQCSDCHEPHGAGLRAPGNTVCAQCHVPAKFDTPEHHHHAPGTPGAQCVDCHMPVRHYMVIDGRRDHSFRVPRPDLTLELGTPNACASCHAERGAVWARDAIRSWRPAPRDEAPHFARALDAGRRGALDAEERLVALALDPEQPAIARATAWGLLPDLASGRTMEALPRALEDGDALVRTAALRALEELACEPVPPAALLALADPLRGVRVAAARALAGLDRSGFSPEQRARFESALQEARDAELALAERPVSWVNLSNLELRLGRPEEALRCLEKARHLDERFVPALLNTADVHRALGDERAARAALERARELEPQNAHVLHALGLLLTRAADRTAALAELRRAHELATGNARYAFVYAVALYETGAAEEALRILEQAHRNRPADRDILGALASYEEQRGNPEAARRWAETLNRLGR